jgi:hypothetical protein
VRRAYAPSSKRSDSLDRYLSRLLNRSLHDFVLALARTGRGFSVAYISLLSGLIQKENPAGHLHDSWRNSNSDNSNPQ